MTWQMAIALSLPVGVLFGMGQMLGRWLIWTHCDLFRKAAWRAFGRR